MPINYKLISEFEGGQKDEFYTVPGEHKNSGVTIGTGFDLGSRTPEELLEAGISPSFVNKMLPFFGKKGEEANEALKNNPVSLDDDDRSQLDRLDALAKRQQLNIVKNQLANEGVDFDSLPPGVQTAVASVGFQYGNIRNLSKKDPKKVSSFFNKVVEGSKSNDYNEVIGELENFGDSFGTRRNREAQYLKDNLQNFQVQNPGVPMARPTNPEAGPSDTVPAMLTPGEAVIPAPAAQNPENQKQIAEMVNEGRVKNDIAEANGVPVTSPEVANIPKEEMGGGFFSNIKEALGFEGGTMEVPNMGMMIPPKDPTMDKMEQLAFKQMDYEVKSKNRTRDTIEKIGLKHLEETADVNMKQAALDETMKNYGMEVPMPMAPVPEAQGFADGSSNVLSDVGNYIMSYPDKFRDSPSDTPLERGLKYTAGLPVKLYNTIYDANKALTGPVSQEEIDAALKADIGEPIKYLTTPMNAVTEVPPQTVAAPPPSNLFEGVDTKLPPPSPDEDQDKTPKETPGMLDKALAGIKSGASEIFDPEALTKGALTYGITQALGYSPETSGKAGLSAYSGSIQEDKDAKAAAAKRQLDMLDYKKKKLIDESIEGPKKARELYLSNRTYLEGLLGETEKGLINRTNKQGTPITGQYRNPLPKSPQVYAAEATRLAEDRAYNLSDPKQLQEFNATIEAAYSQMVSDRNADPNSESGRQYKSIIPYVDAALLRAKSGSDASFKSMFETDEGKLVEPEYMSQLRERLMETINKQEKYKDYSDYRKEDVLGSVLQNLKNSYNQGARSRSAPISGTNEFWTFSMEALKNYGKNPSKN